MPFILRILLALLIITVLEFYFFRKLSKSIHNLFPDLNKRTYKIFVTVFIILLDFYPLILLVNWLLGFIMDSAAPLKLEGPFYDIFLIYPFWTGILIILQSVMFLFLLEFIFLIFKLFYKNKPRRLRYEAVGIMALIAFTAIYVPLRITYDYNAVNFQELTIYKENLNSDLEDFRLVFISDLQADRYTIGKRLQNYIDVVNNAEPDLVLAAGDFITSGPLFIDSAAAYAGRINSELGVYSCVGDHDHWAYREDNKRSLRELSAALLKENVNLIHNRNIEFQIKSADVQVTFVTNSYVDAISLDSLFELTNGESNSDLRIFVSHQPRPQSIEAANNAGYDLFLAGHTHGGQITFLFPYKNLSPTLFETKFVHGNFDIGNMTLIVSSGLGMSLAPIRYNSTPEVILIRFKNKKQELSHGSFKK